MVSEEFGRNLRVALAWRKINGTELAALVGVTPQAVAKILNGKMMPSSGRLVQISRALSVSIEFLLGGDDVAGQIEDVLTDKPPRKTARQLYLEQQSGLGR